MELHKLGNQLHTHTATASAPHKPATQATDGKSTIAHAAEHDDAQTECLECLQQCWDSFVKLVQDLWVSLFPPPAIELDASDAVPAQPTQEELIYHRCLTLIQAHITDTWKDNFDECVVFPCLISAQICIYRDSSPQAAYQQSFTRRFSRQESVQRAHILALNEFSKKVCDELDADRRKNAQSFKDSGLKSVSYALPESRCEMTLACFTPGDAAGTCNVVTVQDQVRDPTVSEDTYKRPKPVRKTFNSGSAKESLEQFCDRARIQKELRALNILKDEKKG